MILDVFIIVVIFLFGFKSFKNGLAYELRTATGWILSILLALRLTTPAKSLLTDYFPSLEALNAYLGFTVALVAVRLVVVLVANAIKTSEGPVLNFVNKFLSTLFGFFKGLFFTSLALILISMTPIQSSINEINDESRTYQPMRHFMRLFYETLRQSIPQFDALAQSLSSESANDMQNAGEELQNAGEEALETGQEMLQRGREQLEQETSNRERQRKPRQLPELNDEVTR